MDRNASVGSCGNVIAHWWHNQRIVQALLVAGIVSVAVYGIVDLVSGLLYDGYSFRDQTISKLSAFGLPVRPLMATAIAIHGMLVAAFGVGIWRSADRGSMRAAGLLLIAAGMVGLPNHTIFAMSSRWMETGFNDTMHIVLTGLFCLIVFLASVLSS